MSQASLAGLTWFRTPAGETVTAVEQQRLREAHAALNDQYEAASEVLEAMGRAAADPDTVLTPIVESARRLCRGQAAQLYVLGKGVYKLIKSVGMSEHSIRLVAVGISAVLFGLLHTEQGLVGVVLATLDAIVFAVLRLRLGTVWAPVLSHGFNNTLGFVKFYAL